MLISAANRFHGRVIPADLWHDLGPRRLRHWWSRLVSCWMGDHVEILWRLSYVEDNISFELWRTISTKGSSDRLAADVVQRREDEFVVQDRTAETGASYTYRVVIREAGELVASFETEITTPPAAFSLEQNQPNPFNPLTRINFTVEQSGPVRLAIYDPRGKLVRTLVRRPMAPGAYTEEWDGFDERRNQVASGVYFYRLTSGGQNLTRKAVLLR